MRNCSRRKKICNPVFVLLLMRSARAEASHNRRRSKRKRAARHRRQRPAPAPRAVRSSRFCLAAQNILDLHKHLLRVGDPLLNAEASTANPHTFIIFLHKQLSGTTRTTLHEFRARGRGSNFDLIIGGWSALLPDSANNPHRTNHSQHVGIKPSGFSAYMTETLSG